MLRLAARGEVGRRADDRHPQVGAHADAHHLALDHLADPDPGVEPLLDDVDERIVDAHVEIDVGVRGSSAAAAVKLRFSATARRAPRPDRSSGIR